MLNKIWILLGALIAIVVFVTLLYSGNDQAEEKYTQTEETIQEIEAIITTTPIPETPEATETQETKEFFITAKQFEFIPETITVNQGDSVKLIVTSMDVTHGFMISQYGINERLEPGKTITVEFIADKKGEFSFFCNVPCGSGHGQMRGTLIVN